MSAARFPLRIAGTALNRALHHLECGVLGRGDDPIAHAPIFILGAPRCGSTLMYQVMLDYFDLGYLSNLHCKFFGAPSLAERAFRPCAFRRATSYKSEHGYVSGWSSPSECGDYWYRFFRRRPQYVPLEDAGERSLADLRRSFRAVCSAMGRHIIFKNLLCALRLDPIHEALPESVFVVVRRSWLDTAHSILEARMKLYGDYGRWFSVEPPDVESLRRLPPHEQVVEQIRGVHALIERGRARAPERFLDVDYESFCANTRGVLERVRDFLEGLGVVLAGDGDVPASFESKRSIRIEGSLYAELEAYLGGAGAPAGGESPAARRQDHD
jgi:hypothetical protein